MIGKLKCLCGAKKHSDSSLCRKCWAKANTDKVKRNPRLKCKCGKAKHRDSVECQDCRAGREAKVTAVPLHDQIVRLLRSSRERGTTPEILATAIGTDITPGRILDELLKLRDATTTALVR